MQKIGSINICGIEYNIKYYNEKFKELNKEYRERGRKYIIDKDVEEKKLPVDGYCDYNSKEICLYNDKCTSPYYFRQVITHEIVHAYLFEIGYSHHDDEEFVDKLSKWIPQIERIVEDGMEVVKHAKSSKRMGSKKKNQARVPRSK